MSNLARKLDYLEPLVLASTGEIEASVYGIVDSIGEDGTERIVRRWKGTIGNMIETDEEPTILIAEKLEPLILKHKKIKGVYGGRAGTKSIAGMQLMIGEVNSCGSKVFVLRERMKSLRQSIYEGIEKNIKRLKFAGFRPLPSHWEIQNSNGGKFAFGGMQNILDMKSLFEFKFFLLEEAARTSLATLDILGPTLRGIKGAEMWMLWNAESANDPMSNEFITPFQADLDRYGYYEDEYHLIIKVGYKDNPWFNTDESLQEELAKDKQKLAEGRMSESRFNHIWDGAFNDDIANSVITADQLDACIDAHKKLGFEGTGATVCGHDPSDVGDDAKGNAVRTGSVFHHLTEIDAPDANTGFDISCRIAKELSVDTFGWDCDGMGALLRNQADRNFKDTRIKSFMYKGSESCHMPEATFQASEDYNMKGQKKNKDVFKNKKAQNIISFAQRVKRTHEAVKLGKYHDPDTLVSFDSSKIAPEMISKLRSESCRMPLKPSDKITFFTKEEMRRGIQLPDGSRVKIPSPNLFDAVVLSFDNSAIMTKTIDTTHRPRPRRVMGR